MQAKPRLVPGMTRVPWGFTVDAVGVLVATTAAADRFRRHEMGETAIKVLAALGIKDDLLDQLAEVEEPTEILDRLQEART